jgi:predicted GNAT family acetyltransferase
VSDVIQNQKLDRFELVIDGELAGYTAYQLSDTTITFTHTEILRQEREHGLGGRLSR